MSENNAEGFAPVIHQNHHHLYNIHAQLPVHSCAELYKDFQWEEPYECITIMPERHFFFGEAPMDDHWVLTCAVLDWKNKVVCTFNGAYEHSHLKLMFKDLPDSMEQYYVDKDVIYGFVTYGGLFVNRETAWGLMSQHHRKLLKPDANGSWFNSEMIDWKAVNMQWRTVSALAFEAKHKQAA